jgi:hypothetical protein
MKGGTMHKTAMFVMFAVAAALAAIIYAIAPNANAKSERTVQLFEHDTQQASLDLGGKGTNPGNLFVYAGDVFDHAGGSKLGRAAGYCMTMSGNAQNPGEVFCTATFVLTRGQIMWEGLFDTAALFTRGETLSAPITGGTGIYLGAHGFGTVQIPPEVPNETDANFVLHLS